LAKEIYVPKTIGRTQLCPKEVESGPTGRHSVNGQTFYAFCLIKIATGYVVLIAATGGWQRKSENKNTEKYSNICYIVI